MAAPRGLVCWYGCPFCTTPEAVGLSSLLADTQLSTGPAQIPGVAPWWLSVTLLLEQFAHSSPGLLCRDHSLESLGICSLPIKRSHEMQRSGCPCRQSFDWSLWSCRMNASFPLLSLAWMVLRIMLFPRVPSLIE